MIDSLKKRSVAVGGSDATDGDGDGDGAALYQVEVTQKEEKSEEVAAGKNGLQSDFGAQKLPLPRARDQDAEERLHRGNGLLL